MSRIGIFAGTFDPVHQGHIEFAKEASRIAKLDKVYFLPERTPSAKRNVADYQHRLAMLGIVADEQSDLEVLDFPDEHISVAATLPRLKSRFTNDQLFLLMGSDVAETFLSWSDKDQLLSQMQIVIGLRKGINKGKIEKILHVPEAIYVDSPKPHASSSKAKNQTAEIIPQSVKIYIKEHNLYRS